MKTHRSILIVEDEEIIRTTLREFLTGEGYTVADAANVNDALRLALSQPPSRREAYHLPTHEATLQPGLDLAGFNRLADELEDEAILANAKRPAS